MPPKQEESKQNQINAEDLNPVVVLRHLTALENYLGSLGPKVIDLLAAVLKMEKVAFYIFPIFSYCLINYEI